MTIRIGNTTLPTLVPNTGSFFSPDGDTGYHQAAAPTHHHHHQNQRNLQIATTPRSDQQQYSYPSPSHTTHQQHQNDRVLRLFLPPNLKSWDLLPPNPLDGLPGITTDTSEMSKEDFCFYCDTCMKGFYHESKFAQHMEEHMFCPVPGCKFTCLKRKVWKMEMHKEALHNRPDAPDLVDTSKYLNQRKSRFPTSETVQSKLEELFYKASKGEEIPDERRRWMRQHGVIVKKRHPASNRCFISSNATKGDLTVDQVEEFAEQQGCRRSSKRPRTESAVGTAPSAPPPYEVAAAAAASSDGAAVNKPHAPAQTRVKLIPEGPNGRLSRAQLVQLVRIKYQAASNVPRFYVCNRCGVKGEHWVQECPTAKDHEFDRSIVWGEPSKHATQQRRPRQEGEGPSNPSEEQLSGEGQAHHETHQGDNDATSSSSSSSCSSAAEEEEEASSDSDAASSAALGERMGIDGNATTKENDDDDAPVEVSARDAPPGAVEEMAEQPKKKVSFASEGGGVASAAAATTTADSAQGPVVVRRRRAPRQRAHSPTLYERLTEQDRIVERGLLLQAIRFFCVNNFFLYSEEEGAEHGDD